MFATINPAMLDPTLTLNAPRDTEVLPLPSINFNEGRAAYEGRPTAPGSAGGLPFDEDADEERLRGEIGRRLGLAIRETDRKNNEEENARRLAGQRNNDGGLPLPVMNWSDPSADVHGQSVGSAPTCQCASGDDEPLVPPTINWKEVSESMRAK